MVNQISGSSHINLSVFKPFATINKSLPPFGATSTGGHFLQQKQACLSSALRNPIKEIHSCNFEKSIKYEHPKRKPTSGGTRRRRSKKKIIISPQLHSILWLGLNGLNGLNGCNLFAFEFIVTHRREIVAAICGRTKANASGQPPTIVFERTFEQRHAAALNLLPSKHATGNCT